MTKVLVDKPTEALSSSAQASTKMTPITFWYHLISSHDIIRNQDSSEYEPNLVSIGSCENMEDFWRIFQHIRKPSDYLMPFDYQVFRTGIKPMWEDECNKKGGKFSLYISKEYSSLFWEEAVFAFAGGVLPYVSEINGITINSRKRFNMMQIWFREFDKEIATKMRKELKMFFQMPMCFNMPSRAFRDNRKEDDLHSNLN